MAKRDILKEAIADAKTVKETAIANAKAALEEAFTPRLKEMLATKLEEMDLEEEAKVDEMLKKNTDMRDDEPDTPEYETEYDVKPMEEDLDEEINLDEILAEIELDEENKEIKEDEATDKEEEGYIDGEEDADEDKDEEELDLEDMSDDDLKGFIEDVIADMVASGELEAGDEFEEEEVETEEDTEEIGTDEVEMDTEVEVDLAEVYKTVEELNETITSKDSELKEANKAIETLKSDLNEVNLLNAKLLYTNKIFKAKTLTESQKVKVLGAFDKAGTVKETKLVFETLSEGLKTKKTSMIKESLGSASRVSRSVNAKKPIVEIDPMVARFKKLAGLK